MTVEFSDGDILSSDCEAIVSPVDCTGAHLALAIARRMPRQADWYRAFARAGQAEPGAVYHVLPKTGDDRLSAARWVLERRRAGGEPLVLFATTKAHFSKPSRLSWVIGCSQGLVDVARDLGLQSVAVPALGCGLGGLAWDDVRPLLVEAGERSGCRAVVHGPR